MVAMMMMMMVGVVVDVYSSCESCKSLGACLTESPRTRRTCHLYHFALLLPVEGSQSKHRVGCYNTIIVHYLAMIIMMIIIC